MKCICGNEVDVGFHDRCGECGRFYHGLFERDGVQRARWGIRPDEKSRPRGKNFIVAGLVIGLVGAAAYTIGYFLPATYATSDASLDRILDRTPLTAVNMWRPALMLFGGGLFGLGPIVWATGQILGAIFWLQREPEPPLPAPAPIETVS